MMPLLPYRDLPIQNVNKDLRMAAVPVSGQPSFIPSENSALLNWMLFDWKVAVCSYLRGEVCLSQKNQKKDTG